MTNNEKLVIRWVKAYRVDNESETIEPVSHEGRLSDYVEFYVGALRDSRRTAPYLPNAQSTQVISLMRRLMGVTIDNMQEADLDYFRGQINERFLSKEVEAQRKVAQMSTIIKSGCLIHAVVTIGASNYYLLAKLNWNEYLESVSMERSNGIAFDSKLLGRSCLAQIEQGTNGMEVTRIDVALDTAHVKYFVVDFLEVHAVYDDATSTGKMVQNVVNLIDRTFKKQNPQVRLELKNAFLCKVRSLEQVDYGLIVDELFCPYFAAATCPIDSLRSQRFIDSLDSLPEEKKFARQFTLVPKSIKARIVRTDFNLGRGVTLSVKGDVVSDPLHNIESGKESDGRSFLKIYTDNYEALSTFASSLEEDADARLKA